MRTHHFNEHWSVTVGDETFEEICLPFDAMLHACRGEDNDNDSNTGYFAGGHYQYRKTFVPEAELLGRIVFLHFECVYQNATVYVNDKECCFHPYGYTPFSVDISEFIQKNQAIEICVDVDNTGKNSRWYSGGGIFRDVSLLSADKNIYIKENGIRLTTNRNYQIEYKVDHVGGTVLVECYDQGQLLAQAKGDCGVLNIEHPSLWSEKHPCLYDFCIKLDNGEKRMEEHWVRYGIRNLQFNEKGLLVNGESVKLAGACIHHDNGLLGAVSNKAVEYRRIKRLKEAGFNAIRMAHQPASRYLLEAADELGMYVMDELFDMFYIHKNPKDYAGYFEKWHLRDAKAMVEHDYNHPSVIMYSIGNEISETAFEKGIQYVKELKDYIHSIDSSRAVTAGINFFLNYFASKGKGVYSNDNKGRVDEKDNVKKIKDSKVGSAFINAIMNNLGTIKNIFSSSPRADRATREAFSYLDIAGYNYGSSRYETDQKRYPNRLIVGSETFPPDLAENWHKVQKSNHIIGDFQWTGWDYLGEAGIGVIAYNEQKSATEKEYPYLLAGSGVIDILGNARPETHLNKLIWGLTSGPYIAMEPVNHSGEKPSHSAWRNSNAVHSYSFEGCENRPATCYVYSDGQQVELYLNNRRIGAKKVKNFKTTFRFVYQKGTLLAKAYDRHHRLIGTDLLTSAEEDVCIDIQKETIGDCLFCDVSLADRHHNIHSNTDRTLKIEVTNGQLSAFGSADPKAEEPYYTNRCTTYQGKALAIIKADGHSNPEIKITEEKQYE